MSSISFPGGSVVYIADTNSTISYKLSSDSSFVPIIWPLTISSSSPGTVIIEFISDITLSSGSNQYFICGSANIQFGSTSLNLDGTRPVITVDGVLSYPGLIQNGDSSPGNNITVYNLEVHAINGSTLETAGDAGGGWIAQKFFSRGATCHIVNCCSIGEISANAGGIVGSFAGSYNGNLTVIGCSSSGLIGDGAGGICGNYAGNITCDSCWSTGVIGSTAGGIMGGLAGYATITNCYSSGIISTGGGGICGAAGGFNGNVVITSCYSTGNVTGSLSGGIAGFGARAITIANCFVTGNVDTMASGIIGESGNIGTKTITNCYTSGTIADAVGYIAGNIAIVNGSSGNFVLSNNYSEAANSSSGWNTSNAITVLTGVPSPVGATWVATGVDQPFELKAMGYIPYSVTNITTSPSPALIRTQSGTVTAGSGTDAAIVSGQGYIILQISGGAGSITINEITGVISTTTATAPGVYEIYVRNTGYNITVYMLTVTSISCCPRLIHLSGVDYTTRASVLAGNAMISGRMSKPMSYSDYIQIKKAKTYV